MPPWAAFEWERTGWTLETIPTETPCSAAARAARWPASPAPMTSTSWDGTGPDGIGGKSDQAVGIRQIRHIGRKRASGPPKAAGRLPLIHVRRPPDHAFPRPGNPRRGRLVVVPDPLPGHLLDDPELRRTAGEDGQPDDALPARPGERRRLLRLDPAARARPRLRRPPQRDRDQLDPALDLRRHGTDGPRGRLAGGRSAGRARRAGGDAGDLPRLRGARDRPRQLDRVPRGGDVRIAGRRPGGAGDVRLAPLHQPSAG